MKIVSGGQTGVDRAALDAALESGVEARGWCPEGRVAEDGVIPEISMNFPRPGISNAPDEMSSTVMEQPSSILVFRQEAQSKQSLIASKSGSLIS